MYIGLDMAARFVEPEKPTPLELACWSLEGLPLPKW
jgi:hypothetical protein